MAKIPVRRDFAFDAKCGAGCNRPLTSNVAVFLRDTQGNELPYGPVCARKALDDEGRRQLRLIPDFTRAASGEERQSLVDRGNPIGDRDGHNVDGRRDGHDEAARIAREFSRAATYLMLRQDRLAHIPRAGFDKLEEYAKVYRETKDLPPDAVVHILALERKQAGGQYGFDNLQAVYAFDCCIRRALTGLPEAKRSFLEDMRGKLSGSLFLTLRQAQAVENWLARIPGHQALDPSGFSWAWS